jgi:hypothetical protein
VDLANKTPRNTPVSPVLMAVVVVILVAIAGLIGWKTVGGSAAPAPVHVDINKVKADIKVNGFGHHGH